MKASSIKFRTAQPHRNDQRKFQTQSVKRMFNTLARAHPILPRYKFAIVRKEFECLPQKHIYYPFNYCWSFMVYTHTHMVCNKMDRGDLVEPKCTAYFRSVLPLTHNFAHNLTSSQLILTM